MCAHLKALYLTVASGKNVFTFPSPNLFEKLAENEI
jgi:hypothetical protein